MYIAPDTCIEHACSWCMSLKRAHTPKRAQPSLSLGKAGIQQSGREGGTELGREGGAGRGGEDRRREQTEEIMEGERQNGGEERERTILRQRGLNEPARSAQRCRVNNEK